MAEYKTDIEIARAAVKKPIYEIGDRLGIPAAQLSPYGHDKAKISAEFTAAQAGKPDGKLILVTAINPTPAGEGKTTTTVGLGDGLNRIGKKAVICVREPSLGPCFGVKGGAAGGGYAQASAKALLDNTELGARDIVKKSLEIAGELCIYTNMNHTIEVLE